jgi:hypothetical protein
MGEAGAKATDERHGRAWSRYFAFADRKAVRGRRERLLVHEVLLLRIEP